MLFSEALAYLDRHINLEATAGRAEGLSLERMQALVGAMANPERSYPCIHLTGTNGKGSTARMTASLVQATGLRVGVYASPHVRSITERISIDGEDIDEAGFAELIASVALFADALDETPSYFELLTAAAFLHFSNEAVDLAVVEVGLLGRFDATNVVDAPIVVVTGIGTDHTDMVGDWQRRIAEEKAGIIKPGSTVVLGETAAEFRDVFEAEKPGQVIEYDVDLVVDRNDVAVGGRVIDVRTPEGAHQDVFVGMHGEHQGHNAALAIAAAEAFFDGPLSDEVLADGFQEVQLPGRLEVTEHVPLVILDGAHTPEAAEALAAALAVDFLTAGRLTFVIGMLGPRDHRAFLEALGVASADLVICVKAPSPRAIPAETLAEAVRALGADVEIAPDASEAIERARALSLDDDVIVVTGSFYVLD